MLDLRDRVVVLTGASSGIGRELARLLARRGARLGLCARRLERLEALREEIRTEGGEAPLVVRCDVGDPEQVQVLQKRVEEVFGEVDVLINNAGRGAFRPFAQLDPAEAREVVETNLLGVIYCTRAFLPGMLARGKGNLVFISSVLGELPAPEHAVYGATKFAVSGLAESLQYELEARGIRVTLIEPGLVMSEFAGVSGTPLKRFEQVPYKSAAAVAGEIVRAVEAEQRRYVADFGSRLAIGFRRHFPRAARMIFSRVIRQMYRK